MQFGWFDSVRDLKSGRELIARRRYGVIDTQRGQFTAIHFRPWPKLISIPEAQWLGRWKHQRGQPDRCQLFFNQPWSHSNYLTLSYIESNWATSLATLRLAVRILDYVAAIKRSDAILCEVTTPRISDRLLLRWGWERHLEHSRRRHWIKRFYGNYERVDCAAVLQSNSSRPASADAPHSSIDH